MIQLFSKDLSEYESHAPSACDQLVWIDTVSELHKKIGSIPLNRRMALCSVHGIGQSFVPVKELAARWNVSTQRIYQLAGEAVNELRQSYRSDAHET